MAAEQQSSANTAFVTGASGFVGGALTRSLIADGWSVRALARSPLAADAVRALGAEPVSGGLDSASGIGAAAEGCSHAFHAAAVAKEWGTRDEFESANVIGTANVLSGCAAAGVERFVHVGSEAAQWTGGPLVKITEDAPLQPDSNTLYAATKARAEQLVLDANRAGFETVVLRPRLVWGPGDTNILPGFAEAVADGRFTWVGNGSHLTSTTHIDNAVLGLRLASEKGRPGRAYFVTDGDPVVFRDFITELLATEGVEPGGRNLPKPLARAIAASSEAAWRRLPLPGEPPLTRMAYALVALECTLDISRARDELGYEPVVSVEEGMAALRAAEASPGGAALTPS